MHWAARGLSFLGRVHVAKQVVAACGIMPASSGPQSSCLKSSANRYASLWHQLSRPATAMILWLWHEAALRAVPIYNRQICQPAASSATANTAYPAAAFLTPQQKPLMLSAGITKVAHLRLSLQLQQPQLLASELGSVLLALPLA